jgi:hypothetical protein
MLHGFGRRPVRFTLIRDFRDGSGIFIDKMSHYLERTYFREGAS